jgi:hypothetical protein
VLLGHAGRVRDPRYDAAVIGNSHAILLDPARLSTTMHLRVVQLAFPALVPPEQFIIARAFLRHHPKAAALIIVLDNDSCGATDPIPNWYFPTYLFEGSEFDYLKNIFSSAALEATAYRSLMLLGLADSPGRPDGFSIFDFPANRRSGRLSRIANMKRPTQGPGVGSPLPALDRLEGFAAGLDPETALLLYFAPAPATTLPLPDSAAAQWLDACKARYRAVAASRPRTVLLDRMTDDDFTQDIDNFEDSEHLRNDLAPMLEHEIEAALRPLLASRVNGESGPE